MTSSRLTTFKQRTELNEAHLGSVQRPAPPQDSAVEGRDPKVPYIVGRWLFNFLSA